MTSSHLRVLHNRHRPLYETVSFWLLAYDAFWGHLWIIFTNSNLGYILPKQALHQYWNTNNNHDWNQTSKWKDNGKTWQVKHVREAVIRLEWFWIPHSTCCCCYTFPLLLSPSANETSSKRKKKSSAAVLRQAVINRKTKSNFFQTQYWSSGVSYRGLLVDGLSFWDSKRARFPFTSELSEPFHIPRIELLF